MPAPIFDEMYSAPEAVRAHYAAYARWLAAQPADVMRSRREEAELIFRRVGITFAVYGAKDEDGAVTRCTRPRRSSRHSSAGITRGIRSKGIRRSVPAPSSSFAP